MNGDNAWKGLATGTGLAAVYSWARHDDETQRRLRNNRNDIRDLDRDFGELLARGEIIRSRLPIVQDVQVGTAMANPNNPPPVTVPGGLPGTVRPQLADVAQIDVGQLSWPPKPGKYSDNGQVVEIGELTVSALAQTFEEFRAMVLGIVQSQSPTAAQKIQIYYAFHALVAQLEAQGLTLAQYRDAWARLFGGSGSVGDVHQDPARPPMVVPGSLGTNVTSVVPLTAGSVPGYPFSNPNTDAAMRFRVTTSGNVVAGTQIASIRFGSDYRYQQPNGSIVAIQPFVTPSPGAYGIYTLGATSQTFEIYNTLQIPAGTLDVFISTTAGVPTVG